MIRLKYFYDLVSSKAVLITRTKRRFVLLLAGALIIACVQLLYSHFHSTILSESRIRADATLRTHYPNPYFETEDGFKVIAEHKGKHTSLEGDVHTILDYTEEEYYLNDEYPEFMNKERLDAELNRQSTFKKFVSELLENILSSKPSIEAINNSNHYNASNVYQKTRMHKMPTLLGKLRENNGVDPIRSKEYLRSYMQLSEDEMAQMK
ncbi:uncharacterized protein CYBJADRAFT_187109, partial [Cyberlindnera jadinii NRRL Y-1542]